MNVGDRVKWLPTGQEGRIFEVRDGGIVAVRGEYWAVYDYADRFELVNEPVSGRDGPDMEKCRHGSTWIIAGGFWEWCYVCGALRQHVRTGSNSSAPSTRWVRPTGDKNDNPHDRMLPLKRYTSR